eukprot:1088097-Alexandrium_andersonii.AAC.1
MRGERRARANQFRAQCAQGCVAAARSVLARCRPRAARRAASFGPSSPHQWLEWPRQLLVGPAASMSALRGPRSTLGPGSSASLAVVCSKSCRPLRRLRRRCDRCCKQLQAPLGFLAPAWVLQPGRPENCGRATCAASLEYSGARAVARKATGSYARARDDVPRTGPLGLSGFKPGFGDLQPRARVVRRSA